jgi:hypothetical protein
MDTIALNTSFVHMTDEGSDSEIDEPPESTIKKKLIISAGDGTGAVTSYVHSTGRIAGIL